MNSTTVFLILTFFTGLHAAALGDAPAKSVLEHFQDPMGSVAMWAENLNLGKLQNFELPGSLQSVVDSVKQASKELSKTFGNMPKLNRKVQQYAKQKLQEGVNQVRSYFPVVNDLMSSAEQAFQGVTDEVNNKVKELHAQVEPIAMDVKERFQEGVKTLTKVGQGFLSLFVEEATLQPHVKDPQKKQAV